MQLFYSLLFLFSSFFIFFEFHLGDKTLAKASTKFCDETTFHPNSATNCGVSCKEFTL